ncbi:hypothetical protein FA15DRAFT_695619 [Coprinopsis marcescibilis]|uniref:Yippee domain-containing protein n=1 Tax=Coprinopsis marcescibilis TaxID=230819 RepID=A0A5C3KQC9_COPMA|nr:hypothetical protein FA15DRAFT_695619 [Coprinopsis marcescibilis]
MSYYNDKFAASSSTLTVEPRSSPVRRLPSLPADRRISRPLPTPKVPRALVCKQCQANITSNNVLLPVSRIPPDSRPTFRGFSGKASLFTETYNVKLAKPGVQLMATGAHTMSEITCGSCHIYLGWKILKAHEASERWKEGYFLLELEHLFAKNDDVAPLSLRPRSRLSYGSTGSE